MRRTMLTHKCLCHHLNCGFTACRWCTFLTNEFSPILSDIQPSIFPSKQHPLSPLHLSTYSHMKTFWPAKVLLNRQTRTRFHHCSHVYHAPDSSAQQRTSPGWRDSSEDLRFVPLDLGRNVEIDWSAYHSIGWYLLNIRWSLCSGYARERADVGRIMRDAADLIWRAANPRVIEEFIENEYNKQD